MNWNIGGKRNLFHQLKTNFGPYRVVLTTPITSPEKLTLTGIAMQHIPEIECLIQEKSFLA